MKASWPALWWVNDRDEEIRWSFEELGFYSRQLANVLIDECRLVRGDRVLLILPRVPEWWLVNIACLRTGKHFHAHTCMRTIALAINCQSGSAKSYGKIVVNSQSYWKMHELENSRLSSLCC